MSITYSYMKGCKGCLLFHDSGADTDKLAVFKRLIKAAVGVYFHGRPSFYFAVMALDRDHIKGRCQQNCIVVLHYRLLSNDIVSRHLHRDCSRLAVEVAVIRERLIVKILRGVFGPD